MKKTATANKELTKAGMTGFYDSLVHSRSLVFQINRSAEKPRLRQYKTRFILLFVLLAQTVSACPVCEKQQPEITQGLTHGTGPQSNWDWVIIAVITAITVLTFVLSLKYLIKPREKGTSHIKRLILNS